MLEKRLETQEDTAKLARALARHMLPDDAIWLKGEVGAGKSTFARAFIQALCPQAQHIPSPTYTLVQTYPVTLAGREVELWHCDLYRLKEPSDLVETGILEQQPGRVMLIEWPGLLAEMMPGEPLIVTLAIPPGASEGVRVARMQGSMRWQKVLREL